MIRITINGEEVICGKNFTITEEMLVTPSIILNNVYPASWEENKDYVSNFYYPPDYSKCLIYDDDELIFCGVVKNTGNISLNPRDPHFCNIEVLDFKTFLSEGTTLDFVIANKTIEEAIEQVTSAISSYGFIVGNIELLNPDEVIGAYSTKDKTAYDVFCYLAEVTQSRWTTRMVDENTVAIDFYDPSLLPIKDDIEYTQEYFENNEIIDMSYNYGTYDYRNKQIMLSDEVLSNITQMETVTADGYQTQFKTEQKIGEIQYIVVNAENKTFTTIQNKELGYTADYYYKPGESYFESAELQPAGEVIIIGYTAIVEGRQIIIDANEIQRVSEITGRNGTITRYERRNDATTSSELQKIGESYIKFKGTPEINLIIQSTKNLWNIGDVMYFDAPLNDLMTEYMVKKKTIEYIVIGETKYIFYTFEMTSSFNSEEKINYFDNQRNKTKGNIGEGETITRNIDIENTANVIFYNTTIEEATVIGDNVLDFGLNAPLNK